MSASDDDLDVDPEEEEIDLEDETEIVLRIGLSRKQMQKNFPRDH
jgi:hypothetical protein